MKRFWTIVVLSIILVLSLTLIGCNKDKNDSGSKWLTYSLINEDKEYEVIGINTESITDTGIVIPDYHNGKPITSIKENAFSNNDKITSIKIGNNVKIIGENAFYDCKNLKNIDLGNSVIYIEKNAFYNVSCKNLVIPNSVKEIDEGAFSGNDYLITLTLGENVTTIENTAFSYCESLLEICNNSNLELVKGSEQYGSVAKNALNIYTKTSGASKIIKKDNFIIFSGEEDKILMSYTGSSLEITLPSEITRVFNYAFYQSNIRKVTIGNNVTTIGRFAFGVCESLKNVTLGSSVKFIDDGAFYFSGVNSINLPEGLISIGEYAFCNCENLETITFPNTTKNIGNGAFSSTNIKNVVLPDGIETFKNAFDLSKLNLNVKNNLKYLGSVSNQYFYLAGLEIDDNLQAITISANCKFIKSGLLNSVLELTNIYVEDGSESFCSIDGVLYNKNVTTLVQYPKMKTDTSFTVPSSVTKIEDNAFYYCKKIREVVIGDNVTSIGDSAFEKCYSLTMLTIGKSVNYIGKYAFYWTFYYGGSVTFKNVNGWKCNGKEFSADELSDNSKAADCLTRYYDYCWTRT